MPSYGKTSPSLERDGLLVNLRISVHPYQDSALKKAAKSTPQPVSAVAMIDTGAGKSVVKSGLLSRLGILPTGVTLMHTATQANVPCPQFAVTLHFPERVANMWWRGLVAEMPIPIANVDCLLGRDVLSYGILVYSGVTQSWTFSL